MTAARAVALLWLLATVLWLVILVDAIPPASWERWFTSTRLGRVLEASWDRVRWPLHR